MNTWTKSLAGALLAGAVALGGAAPAVAADEPAPEPSKPQYASKSKPQADRWGLFVGEWTPTFFAIGVAAAPGPGDRDDGTVSTQMISTIQNLGVRSEHAY